MLELTKVDEHWLKELSGNSDIWYEGSSEKWPSIIAYEYRALRDFCIKEHPYCVLMCIKDNFEAFLKLEVLLAYAWAYKNTDESFQRNTISLITTPNLSMGAWMELARLLLEALKETESELPSDLPISNVLKYYNDIEIVNWRNEKIGHGAMELEDDQDFREELREKLQEVSQMYKEFNRYLNNQKLYVGSVCLEGPDMARRLPNDLMGTVDCLLVRDNERFNADPYILLCQHEKRGKGLYFFDNQKNRLLTIFQTYADGSRTSNPNAYFENLRKALDQGSVQLSADVEDPYLNEVEMRELELLQMNHSFVHPLYITKWLQERLGKQKKGVFLLQMDRGTGKSVYTEKLNCLYDRPLRILDDLDVRTYHFVRSQTAGLEDVFSRIEWSWANEHGQKFSWQKAPRISDYQRNGNSPADSLNKFLEYVLGYSKRNRKTHRIMMVFDGLDEIVDEILWELFPEADKLSEGIYILLTSRKRGEEAGLSWRLGQVVEKIGKQNVLNVDSEQEGNKVFLQSYIKKTKARSVSEKIRNILLEKAKYKVLYLGMLCRLIDQGLNPEVLPDAGKIVEAYLSALEKSYGEKEGIRIREVLAVLSTVGMMEPLSLSQLGGLTSEGRVTLGLIGMVRDLSPMLKVVRESEGNCYMVTNNDLAMELRKQLSETDETINALIQLGKSEIVNLDDLPSVEIEVILSHIYDLAEMLCESRAMEHEALPKEKEILDKQFVKSFASFIEVMTGKAQSTKQKMVLCKYYMQLIKCATALYGELHERTMKHRADLLRIYMELTFYEKSLNEINIIARYLKEVKGGEDDSNGDVLLLLHLQGIQLLALDRIEEAFRINSLVYTECLRLLGDKDPITLMSQVVLGETYEAQGDARNAGKALREACAKMEKYLGAEHLDTLTGKYKLGCLYLSINNYKKAADIFEKLIDPMIRVLGKGSETTISCLNSLSEALQNLNEKEGAVVYSKQSLDYSIDCYGKEHPITLVAMVYLGDAYRYQGDFVNALELLETALEGMKKIIGLEDSRTMYCMNRLGLVYCYYKRYNEAVALFKENLMYHKRYFGIVHEKVAYDLYCIGNVYYEQGIFKEALATFEEALTIANQCMDNNPQIYDIKKQLFATYLKTNKTSEALSLIVDLLSGPEGNEIKKILESSIK